MKSDYDSFTCSCWDGYEGKTCDREINECRGNPCERGRCVDGINFYECDCPSRYDGVKCEVTLDSIQELVQKNEVVFEYTVPECVTDESELFGYIFDSVAHLFGSSGGRGLTLESDRCIDSANRRMLEEPDLKTSQTDVKMNDRRRLTFTQTFDLQVLTNDSNDAQEVQDILYDETSLKNTIHGYITENTDQFDGVSFEGLWGLESTGFEDTIYYQWRRGEWDIQECPMECDQEEQTVRTRDVNCVGSHGLIGEHYLCINVQPEEMDVCPFNSCTKVVDEAVNDSKHGDEDSSMTTINEEKSDTSEEEKSDSDQSSNASVMLPIIIIAVILALCSLCYVFYFKSKHKELINSKEGVELQKRNPAKSRADDGLGLTDDGWTTRAEGQEPGTKREANFSTIASPCSDLEEPVGETPGLQTLREMKSCEK
eukprot:UN23375